MVTILHCWSFHYLCFNLQVLLLAPNSDVSLKYQTEIHGADTNNLFNAVDKEQQDCVHVK